MKIYMVEGQTGEYSDHREWPVKAFVSEKRAADFVLAVTAEYHRVGGENFRYYHGGAEANRLDPDMQVDYTGTTYSFYSVELDTEE